MQHEYPQAYSIESIKDGIKRLCIAASHNGSELVRQLSGALSEPFSALYILVVGRGTSKEGRYQSPQMSRQETDTFFGDHATFFDEDGRHHVWLFSYSNKATLAYDRHNVIYAYGPIDEYQKILGRIGYQQVDSIKIPSPHGHQYHAEFDENERKIASSAHWIYSPLRDVDSN